MTTETRPAPRGSKRAKTGSRTGTTKKKAASATGTPASKTTKKAAAKKKATHKVVRKAATKKKAVAKRAKATTTAPAVGAPSRRSVSADERRRMIAEAAYYRAERLGGRVDPTRNWLEAEAEIDAMLVGERRAD